MLEVVSHRTIPAPPEAVWADIADPDRFAEWYAFCDAVETPEPGTRVLLGSWGAQRSAVTTRITADEAPRRFAWTHVDETLDGRSTAMTAIETTVEILLGVVDDGTEVTITSRQQAAGWWQSVAMRLLGKRTVGNMLDQSLTILESRHR